MSQQIVNLQPISPNLLGLDFAVRPTNLATDTSNLFDVIKYHLKELEKLPDYVLRLPTSPLRQTKDIDAVIELSKNYDAVISVTKAQNRLLGRKNLIQTLIWNHSKIRVGQNTIPTS